MALTYRGDILLNGATFFGAVASGNAICTVTNEPKFRRYNYNTLGPVASANGTGVEFATLTGSSPSDISFIAAASCVISYSGSSEFDIVDINTMNLTKITSNANPTEATSTQQIAGNINLNLAMATKNSTGSVSLVSLATATSLSPAGLSGAKATSVVVRPDTNTWIIGTSNGKVMELNASGTILNTISLPVTPAVSTPTINVFGVSFSYPNLMAATDTGVCFVFNWVTQTFLYKFMSADGLPVLCAASSGMTLLAKKEYTGSTEGCPLSEVYFEQPYPIPESYFFNEASVAVLSMNIENTLNYAMACFNESNFVQLRVYNMLPTNKVFVNTRMQDPPGTDISGRVIRLRDNGIGTASVEIDQAISAGANAVQCTNGRNYIELGIESTTKFDVREFQG